MTHMKEQNCIEAENLKPVFALIDEHFTYHAEREKVKRNIMDVLNAPQSLVSIDVNDVRDLFQRSRDIHTFEVSVDADKENRIVLMMDQINKLSKCHEPYNRALIFFYFPKALPLLMEELRPLSDWIDSVSGEFIIKWGMATHSTSSIRAIVALGYGI